MDFNFKGFYDEIIFDVDRSILKSYTGKQGDTKSRGLYVTVTQKNAVIEDLTGLSMRLFYEKPDKTRGFINGVVDGSKFRIDYTNQMYAVPGVVKAELRLTGPDGEIITAKTFKILVDSSIADGSIVSENERGILDRAFELAEDIIPRLELLDVELLEDVQAEMLGARHSNTKDESYDSLGARLDAAEQDLLDHKAEYTSNRQQDQLKVTDVQNEMLGARHSNTKDETYENLGDRLDAAEQDLLDHKAEYTSNRQQDQLKIAKVEKELNDYKATMQQVNINQEPKQKVSGYGTVSLPKNAANGQVSVSVKGNTETDEEGNAKSTISASRLKSVGKNLWGIKHNSDKMYNQIDGGVLSGSKQISNYKNYIVGKIKVKKQIYTIIPDEKTTFIPNAKLPWALFTKNGYVEKGILIAPNRIRAIELDGEYDIILGSYWNKQLDKNDYCNLKYLGIDEEYEPYKESTAYVIAKDKDNKIVNLRSLPNGVRDEISLSERKLIKRVSNEYTINSDLIQQVTSHYYKEKATSCHLILNIDNTVPSVTEVSNDNAYIVQKGIKFSPQDGWGASDIRWDKDFPQYCIFTTFYDGRMKLTVSLPHTMTGWEGSPTTQQIRDYFNANPITLTYQLAEPENILIEVSGNIVAHPNGTVYIEHGTFTAGVYEVNGIAVTNTGLPIKTINKITKIDYTTGLEYDLDISQAVISEDKLLFTHPDLTAGDIVFFDYDYDVESTEGLATVEFYDSRYVIEDKSIAGKYYTWKVEVDNGVPSITVVEV